MKYSTTLILSALLLPTFAQAASTTVTPQGKQFLNYAVQDSIGEISLCQMAEQKTTNASVKSFCARAISDHKNMVAEATQVAQNLGVTITRQPSDESQTEMQKLSQLPSATFATEFMQVQVQDHEKDISKAETVLGQAKNPQVKALIQQSLPVLQTHLSLAKTTLNSLK